ncbi:hypothetical protein SEA_UNTPL_81 [Streptomyces phage UNTPL]|nr:hypothetical protein SEA_UNTPL_81 [Streptomyces phage UNTPL]
MIDPTPYIKLVDALNEVEALVKESAKESNGELSLSGIVFHGKGSQHGTDLDMGAHYSIQYDSEADRWTLISETDDAPDLCSHNQVVGEECRETDPCEQCYQVQVRLAEEYDRING